MEGENPVLKDGGNAEKPLLTRFCVAKSVISPSKPPSLTENFPQEHPPVQCEDLIRFVQGGCSWGKFLLVREVGSCYSVRLSRFLICGQRAERMPGAVQSRIGNQATKSRGHKAPCDEMFRRLSQPPLETFVSLTVTVTVSV